MAGTRVKAVLDTGCQGSAVSEKFLLKYVNSESYTTVGVSRPRGANDEPLECDSKVFMPTLFGDLAS